MAKSSKKEEKKTSAIDAKALGFMKEYLNTPSPVGFEKSGQGVWLNYIKPMPMRYSPTLMERR